MYGELGRRHHGQCKSRISAKGRFPASCLRNLANGLSRTVLTSYDQEVMALSCWTISSCRQRSFAVLHSGFDDCLRGREACEYLMTILNLTASVGSRGFDQSKTKVLPRGRAPLCPPCGLAEKLPCTGNIKQRLIRISYDLLIEVKYSSQGGAAAIRWDGSSSHP